MILINDNLIEFKMGLILMRFPLSEKALAKACINMVLEGTIMRREQIQP